jgi:hypothetical protein
MYLSTRCAQPACLSLFRTCVQSGFSSLPSMERDGSHSSLNGLAAATPPGKGPAAAKIGSSGKADAAAATV